MEDCCMKHINEQLRFFCTDCENLICVECIDDGHNKHAFCSVRKIADSKRRELTDQISDKQTHFERLHSFSEKIQQCKDSFSNKTEEQIGKIDEKATYLINQIYKVRDKLVSMVLHYQQLCEEPFTEAQRKIDECLSLINNYSSVLDSPEEQSDVMIIQMQTCLHQKLGSVPNPDDISIGPQMEFIEKGEVNGNDGVESLFGTFTLNSLSEEEELDELLKQKKDVATNTDFDLHVIHEDQQKDEDTPENLTDDNSALVPVPIMDEYQDVMLDLEVEGQGAVNKIMPCFNSKSAYILTGNSVKFVQVITPDCNSSEKSLRKLKALETILSRVKDVSMVSHGHLFFVEENCSSVKQYISDQVVVFAEFPKGSTLHSIEASSDDHIHVCYSKLLENRQRTCVTELDSDGVQLNSVIMSMTYRFPHRFCCNINGDMPFLDLEGPGISRGCVRVLNKDFKHVATYAGAIGPKPSENFEPRGICCDADSNIIVTDCRNHAVHLLNPKGKYVRLLLTRKDGVRHPISANLGLNGLLWIGCLYGKVHVRKYKDLFL